jgi:hypothetical protein
MDFSHYAVPAILMIVLVARRVMRSIGFQKFSQVRLIVRIVLISLLSLILLIGAAFHPLSYLTDFGGMLLGLVLLYWSAKHSVFERRQDGLYYRTNIWIELIVVVLFLSRFIYRIGIFYNAFSGQVETPEELKSRLEALRDPYTGALIFILFTYYVGYSIFVLRKNTALNQAKI